LVNTQLIRKAGIGKENREIIRPFKRNESYLTKEGIKSNINALLGSLKNVLILDLTFSLTPSHCEAIQ